MSAALDVERLARALEAVWIAGSDAELTHVSNPHPRLAERIAREYARLSSSVVTVNDDGTADVAEAS